MTTPAASRSWRWRVLAIPILCVGAVTSGVRAQQAPVQLTLDDALELARQRNPAYRRALAQADAARADVLAGVGAFLPDLRGNLGFNGSSRTVVTGTDDFGHPVTLDDPVTFQGSSSSQGLQTGITLFDGLQNVNRLRGARADAAAADAGVQAQAIGIEAEIKRRFYQVLRIQELIAIEERLLDARRDELAATESLFRVAGREQVDVLGAQVEVARQEQNLEAARGEVRKARLLLAEEIGIENAEFEIAGEFPELVDPSGLDADSVVGVVLRSDPRLKQADARAVGAQYAASAARGQRWPTVSASAGFSRSVSQDGYDALFRLNPRDRLWSFGFSVSVPVFERFSISQSIARAAANQRTAAEDRREIGLQVEREVRSTLIDVDNSYRQFQLAQRSAELGRRRLDMARQQYQLGSRTFTELQQIVSTSAQDERQALAARLDYVNAVVALESLIGGPVRP